MRAGRVVVGVDFSAPAGRAVREARHLAGRLGYGMQLVHVREDRADEPWTPDEVARQWMAREGVTSHDVTTRAGIPWVELIRLTESDAELLVLGTHGRSGSQPLALGTTASRVVLASTRPVLLVGEREAHGSSDPAPPRSGSGRSMVTSTRGSEGPHPSNPESNR